jgi:tRNA-dihydrouridine synthase A
MLGRAAYHDPALLLQVDARIFGCGERIRTPAEAARDFRPWIIRRLEQGMPLHSMTRHMLGLFHGRPGARLWRRILSEKAPGARGAPAISVFDEALAHVQAQQSSDVTVGA